MRLFPIFLFLSLVSFGQNWSTDNYKYGELYEGYIVDSKGQRFDGYIKYRNRMIMQEEVIFYRELNNPSVKKKYETADLKEFKVADKHYHVIPYSGSKVKFEMRANLVVSDEGCFKKYVWYTPASGYKTMKKLPGESSEDFGNRKFPPTAVYYKEGATYGITDETFEDNFPKLMAAYINDNKELSKKVKQKQQGYGMNDLLNIIAEYNKACGN